MHRLLRPRVGVDHARCGAAPGELDARIRLALQASVRSSQLSAGPVLIDEESYQASVGGESMMTTMSSESLRASDCIR